MHVRGYAVRTWWTLWPRFRGSRAHVADRRRAISVAVKPMDVVALSDVLSYTLCVIHAHTLEARTVPVWLTLDTKCL